MSNAPQEAVFQFVPLASFVQGSFWHKLTETKLDVDRLSDASRPVTGFYSNSNSVHCVTEVDCTSFNRYNIHIYRHQFVVTVLIVVRGNNVLFILNY